MKEAYIVDAVRSPIGNLGGVLSGIRADDLAAHVIQALLGRHPNLDPARIDDVVLGCANQAGEDNRKRGADGAVAGGPTGQRAG
jgi:acetyl-CoA acetyltransferase